MVEKLEAVEEIVEEIRIQGKAVDSKEELWMAVALQEADLKFNFHVSINGGKSRRGGYVLDFEVFTPLAVAVPVQGEYWHKDELDPIERINMNMLYQRYGHPNVKPIWDSEMPDYEAVKQWVRRELI